MSTSPMSDMPSNQNAYMLPASFAQQRLWFLDQLEPHSAAYNIPTSIRLNFAVDVKALERSLNALVERHEVLRTTFADVDGQPIQVIAPSLNVPLRVVDLSALSEAQRNAEALRLADEEVQAPFDLVRGPLLRATLLRLATEKHVLLLTIHHIICDGWSLSVLYEELAAVYQTTSAGQPSPLPGLPIQYADFALWQQEWLQGEELAAHLGYWKQRLAGAPGVLQLPTDRPHPSIPTTQGSTFVITLPTELSEALKTLSRQEGVTLYITLVAAFQALLHRYSDQDDMVLGTFTAGRTQVETESLLGFFINTVILRTDLSGNPSFRDLLKRAREVILEAFAHQAVPFDYLVRELHPTRSLGQNPLFQVMLVLAPPLPDLPSGWEPAKIVGETGAAKFDLSLELADRPEGLICSFEYSTNLFDEATIARMAGHWRTLLEGILANPSQRLSELPLLTEAERHQLLVEWNATGAEYPKHLSLGQLFDAQVERTPDAVAAIYEHEQLTYRELNGRADQLARHLQRLGVGLETRVGICVQRSLDMLVGLLGVLKAGGAYVPLDPTYPSERLAFMIEDAQVPVVLTQQPLIERLPRHQAEVVCLDSTWAAIAEESAEDPDSCATGDNLAYLLYTSGSTGNPKGVLGTHRATINRLWWMWQTYPFEPGEVCCQRTSLSFVDSVWEIFGPLLQGIPTVIVPDPVAKDPLQMLQTLVVHGVTRIVVVPSLLHVLLDAQDHTQTELPSLKYCVSSGETLPTDLAQHFARTMPHSVLLNLYGSSEVAADVTSYEIQTDETYAATPIGRPIANTQIYLLDRHAQLVPIGVTGELHVGGDGVARGYFNRPELTVERFIPHHFSAVPGTRLYKTGDVARYRADGNIALVGRLDYQVKIRGMRVELGEPEAVLAQHHAVHQAVVMARDDALGGERLVAYVVLRPGHATTASDLRDHLKAKLPDYMVPSAFVILDALPVTPNGKVDRRSLPAPEDGGSEIETFVAPRTPLEELVAGCWSQVLGIQRVGIHDDFFDLGGHSLAAMQVISRLRMMAQVEVPLRSFFEAPTVAQLAEVVGQLKDQGSTLKMPAIRPRPRDAYRIAASALPATQQSDEQWAALPQE
jgi:amino acid adenylation domain-containing protein